MIINKSKNKKGFTLIETLVSLALFSVVLVITGGVTVSIININKKNQAISTVVSNLNYSIDSMIRDIKTGYSYRCNYNGPVFTVDALKSSPKNPGVCLDGLTLISTISGNDVVITYKIITPVEGSGYIQKTVYSVDGSINYSITDKTNVDITGLFFDIKTPLPLDDSSGGLKGQPSVFVSIKGKSGAEDVEASDFFVQTYISQRLLNLTN